MKSYGCHIEEIAYKMYSISFPRGSGEVGPLFAKLCSRIEPVSLGRSIGHNPWAMTLLDFLSCDFALMTQLFESANY